jgi:hypothetical protein
MSACIPADAITHLGFLQAFQKKQMITVGGPQSEKMLDNRVNMTSCGGFVVLLILLKASKLGAMQLPQTHSCRTLDLLRVRME